MNIYAERIVCGSIDKPIEVRRRYQAAPDGLSYAELKLYEAESDFIGSCEIRTSTDGGKSWSAWKDESAKYYRLEGDTEYLTHNCLICETYNPVYKHYVGALMQRIYPGGRRKCLDSYFSDPSRMPYSERVCITLRKPGETEFQTLPVPFTVGGKCPNTYFGTNVCVMQNGDILVPLGPSIADCCLMTGQDPSTFFPSSPKIMRGAVIARGHWNNETNSYEFSYSNPIMITDLLSSRGLDEPTVEELPNGRILVVMRGSNVRNPGWHTRIEPGAPAFKWYAYSDDGGHTFTQALPWRSTDGKAVYSSATISVLEKFADGSVYWIGNITEGAYGNMPRYPLFIAKVDPEYGTLMSDSLTVIDTRREGETDDVQLSNFYVTKDEDSKTLEITLTKFGQFDSKNPFHGDTWRYKVTLD